MRCPLLFRPCKEIECSVGFLLRMCQVVVTALRFMFLTVTQQLESAIEHTPSEPQTVTRIVVCLLVIVATA
eukprot:3650213-Amphidinium_carterae.1